MKVLPWMLVVLLIGTVLYLWNRSVEPLPVEVIRDTVNYVDTIRYYHPKPKDSVVIRYETVKLPVEKDSCESKKRDTCVFLPDYVDVKIPITRKEYKDSLYRAWVSGYNAKLDSIEICTPTRIITEKVFVQSKRKRWGLGVQAGYGYPSGLYIGVGVSYTLFNW